MRRRLNKPEYLLQPSAALRRLRMGGPARDAHSGTSHEVSLPWSGTMTVLGDEIGRSILISGVFDLTATEAIYRLLAPGGTAVDVGANVGYLTHLMATRLGRDGEVLAFEPHPAVYRTLAHNAERWNDRGGIAAVEAHPLALSDEAGTGHLSGQVEFDHHAGLGALRTSSEPPSAGDHEVRTARLDEVVGDREVQLLKVDVEGHEHAVLRGGGDLIASRRVRDVVFEEHGAYPSPAMTLLEEWGMTVLTLDHSLFGLRVHPVQEGLAPPGWPGPNYLATFDARRALRLLGPRGWRTLRRH